MLTTATGAAAEERTGPNELAVPAPVEPKTEFPLVAILLSTFDGARFLREQLHSYLGQTWHNWRLYWRDDGSLDESVGLLDAFAAEAANGHCIRNGETAHLGAAGSFFALLRGGLTGPAAFFAYSDQDDVWLPAKLSNGATALQAIPHHK